MLSAGAMLTVVLLAFAIPLSISIAHHTLDEARVQELADASRLATRISDSVAGASNVRPEALQRGVDLRSEVRSVAATSGLRVLVLDRRRLVLDDSTDALRVGASVPDPDGELSRVFTHDIRFTADQVVTRVGNLVLTLPVFEAGEVVGAVRVSRPLSSVSSSTLRTNLALASFAALALVVGLVVAGWLATLVTRPIRRLEAVATRLGAGDLDARAAESGTRDLVSLSRSFNAMAADLVANLRAQQDFAANASHQLKTPLTALQLRLEAIAGGRGSGVDTEDEARHALADVARLTGLMHDLLTLARATAPVRGGEPVDLGELATMVVDRWSETARRRDKQLALDVRDPATVTADPHDLEDLVDNLLDNAVRYSGDAPRIEITVDGATLSVANHGPIIPAEERGQIFDRFFRGVRGRGISRGTGLGLAIVDALARRWGARVTLAEGAPTRFEVRFPRRTIVTPPRNRGSRRQTEAGG